MGDYLLIPAMPTPNGRLHLGHMAGPYLRMDVLARRLRRAGHRAWLISGTDAYESHVLPAAEREGASPREVCTRYHRRMERDLAALRVELDAFIDPLDPRWHDAFARAHRELLGRLVSGGRTVSLRERFLYSPATRRFVVGCWLSGRCPLCGGGVGGYCCEGCGYHFRPDEVEEPRATFDGPLEWREVDCLHLRLPDGGRLANGEHRGLLTTYLRRQAGLFRLTIPGAWGIAADAPGAGSGAVLFSYGAAGYPLLIGDVQRALAGADRNAFDRGSDVTIVCACGMDNVVPFLAGVQGALLAAGFRPYHHLLVNHFLSLEGRKFSTSRGHAIWTADAVERTPMSSDALRYALATISPERGDADLRLPELVQTINGEFADLHRWAARAAAALEPGPLAAPDDVLLARLRSVVASQDGALDPARCDLRRAARSIWSWMEAYPASGSAGSAHWWLKGFALVVWPLLPDLGGDLWRALGGDGDPAWATFLRPGFAGGRLRPCPPPRLRRSDLAAVLPPGVAG